MSSNERISTIIFKMLSGEHLSIFELSEYYNINIRTIQRDFEKIKITAKSFGYTLTYISTTQKYYLSYPKKLDFKDSLALIKILLASRALPKREMTKLLFNIINLNSESEIDIIKNSINNELTFYFPLQHNADLLDKIEQMSHYIKKKRILRIEYQKWDHSLTNRSVLPVSIFFSEYYFYIICYEVTQKKYINLRLDRFIAITETNDFVSIGHQERLEEKDIREKMLLMQYGRKLIFQFKFSGVVESALDKFPNSRVIKSFNDNSVLIEAEAYDTGIIMWILSQSHKAEIVYPPSLVQKIKLEIKKMTELYA